jgi:hypothetical protein
MGQRSAALMPLHRRAADGVSSGFKPPLLQGLKRHQYRAPRPGDTDPLPWRASRSAIGSTLLALLLALVSVSLSSVCDGQTVTVTITNYTSYVDVHFISIPNKNNFLQGAWVYTTNAIAPGYTNLLWTNLTTYPALPPPAAHLFFKDYSVTNKVTNRFRIYRQKVT